LPQIPLEIITLHSKQLISKNEKWEGVKSKEIFRKVMHDRDTLVGIVTYEKESQ